MNSKGKDVKTFNEQAQASIDEIDMEAAQKRLDAMNLSKPGPTLTPVPQTQPQAPAPRKKRSDAGIPKKAPADPEEITVKMTINEARLVALCVGAADYTPADLAGRIQDQIIAQLQKRLDALQKQK